MIFTKVLTLAGLVATISAAPAPFVSLTTELNQVKPSANIDAALAKVLVEHGKKQLPTVHHVPISPTRTSKPSQLPSSAALAQVMNDVTKSVDIEVFLASLLARLGNVSFVPEDRFKALPGAVMPAKDFLGGDDMLPCPTAIAIDCAVWAAAWDPEILCQRGDGEEVCTSFASTLPRDMDVIAPSIYAKVAAAMPTTSTVDTTMNESDLSDLWSTDDTDVEWNTPRTLHQQELHSRIMELVGRPTPTVDEVTERNLNHGTYPAPAATTTTAHHLSPENYQYALTHVESYTLPDHHDHSTASHHATPDNDSHEPTHIPAQTDYPTPSESPSHRSHSHTRDPVYLPSEPLHYLIPASSDLPLYEIATLIAKRKAETTAVALE